LKWVRLTLKLGRTSDDGKVLWLDRDRVSAGHTGWQKSSCLFETSLPLHSRTHERLSTSALSLELEWPAGDYVR
jgi:hypothetical protein